MSWNMNSNKTGKLSIPVINNTSPHNYVIMPALLSLIDPPAAAAATVAGSCFSKKNLQNETNSSTNIINKLNKKNISTNKSLFKSSKEIIYTSKRKLSNIKENNKKAISLPTSPVINTTNLIQTNYVGNNNSSYFISTDKQIEETHHHNHSIDYQIYELNSISFTNDQPTNNNRIQLDMASLINMPSNKQIINLSNEKESFFSDSILNTNNSIQTTSDYSSLFNESSETQDNNFNYESSSSSSSSSISLNEENNNNTENRNNYDTYAISYPSDWQYNLNSLLNCYVSFKNIRNDEPINDLKLKCSVCLKEFSVLNDLLVHKENNEQCKNNIEIINEKSKLSSKVMTNINLISNYYQDEESEDFFSDENDESFDIDDYDDDDDDEEENLCDIDEKDGQNLKLISNSKKTKQQKAKSNGYKINKLIFYLLYEFNF
jgi:hypothetical protein